MKEKKRLNNVLYRLICVFRDDNEIDGKLITNLDENCNTKRNLFPENGINEHEENSPSELPPANGVVADCHQNGIDASQESKETHCNGNDSTLNNNSSQENFEPSTPNSNYSDISVNYRLSAIVRHSGTSLIQGHYTCYTFNDSMQSWFLCDDETVEKKTFESVQETVSTSCYCLFYVFDS